MPATLNVCVKLLPGWMIAEANAPLLATTWWSLVSRFVHLTASVVAIVTFAGEKPVALMLTPFVTTEAEFDAPATRSAPAASVARTKLRIYLNPPGLAAFVVGETDGCAKSFARLHDPYTPFQPP